MLYTFCIICYKSMKTFPDYKTNHKDLKKETPKRKRPGVFQAASGLIAELNAQAVACLLLVALDGCLGSCKAGDRNAER